MGCTSTIMDDQYLHVATLNYSGILLSPYEFFASQIENETIHKYSQTFAKLCKQEIASFDAKDFKWNLGKLDQHWQLNRYTPIYNPTCGIKNNVYLVDEGQFKSRWIEAYEKKKAEMQALYLKKEKGKQEKSDSEKLKDLEQHLRNCLKFDMMCYKTLLKVIYNIDSIEKVDVSAKKYKQHQRKFFSKSFLKESEKAKLIIESIVKNRIDVLFLQETTDKLVTEIQKLTNQYRICKGGKNIDGELCKSVILIRQKRFPKLRCLKQQNNIFYRNYRKLEKKDTVQAKLTTEELKELNWNEDTVIQVIGNIIFICTHLTSKQANNVKQIALMKKDLYKLKICFPSYHIICGGDLNGPFKLQGLQHDVGRQLFLHGKAKNVNDQQIKQILEDLDFHVFPTHPYGLTVNKKRTMMQAQRRKANQLSNGVKDYIISDLQVGSGKVKTIKGRQIAIQSDQIPLLPNQDHPYDHYLVTSVIRLNSPITHNYEANILKTYNPKKLTKQQVEQLQMIETTD